MTVQIYNYNVFFSLFGKENFYLYIVQITKPDFPSNSSSPPLPCRGEGDDEHPFPTVKGSSTEGKEKYLKVLILIIVKREQEYLDFFVNKYNVNLSAAVGFASNDSKVTKALFKQILRET